MGKKKQIVHLWIGQWGTACGLSHISHKDGFVWLSKMNTPVAVQVNCKKCLESYEQTNREKVPSDKRLVKIQVLGGCASVVECPEDIEIEIENLD